MKPWKLGLLTISTLVFLMPRAGFAENAREEANQVTAYQFRGDQMAATDGVVEGRIEYEVNGKTVHTERVSFRIEPGGKATFLVPDPAHVAALGRTPETAKVRLHVYAGDVLLDSFDRAGFRAYNERLWRAERETGLELITAAVDTCTTACKQSYNNCIRAGHVGCDTVYQECLGGCPNYDSDLDGIPNGSDNCVFTANPNQANCDGDGLGNACDGFNANYQTVLPDRTCMTDKDLHSFGYFTFEHHVEWLERDVSSCGAPDRWRKRIREDNSCVGISDRECCLGLDDSIRAVGDDPNYWCSFNVMNRNFCH